MSKYWDDDNSWFVNLVKTNPILQCLSSSERSKVDSLEFNYEGDRNAAQQPHGKGKMEFQNGDWYSGHWFKGKLHGYASAKILVDGNSQSYKDYTGEFQNGKQHGQGKFTWPDGEFYDGEWQYGLFHGHGIYGTPDGLSVSCTFLNGLPEIGSKCQVVTPETMPLNIRKTRA